VYPPVLLHNNYRENAFSEGRAKKPLKQLLLIDSIVVPKEFVVSLLYE